MDEGLTDAQRATITTLADTVFPALDGVDDPNGFWGRKASDMHVPLAIEFYMALSVPPHQRMGLQALLDALDEDGFNDPAKTQAEREAMLHDAASWTDSSAIAVGSFIKLVLTMAYALPDEHGRNPNWATLGFPGPLSAPPATPKPITPTTFDGETATTEADVCVIGSGSGGGVVAGVLAAQGYRVTVLEAGGYFNEADFDQLEISGYQKLYYRGGPVPTADNNVAMLAGACLGGGSTVNWTNCLRTKPWIRAQWAKEFGLDGLDAAAYDRCLDAVLERISANDGCSDLNGPHKRLKEGAEKLGYSYKTIIRNTDPATYEFKSAGYMGFGDQSGSKQGTLKTYLQDAFDHDAQIVVNCSARRVLVEDGHASGVEAVCTNADGSKTTLTVKAKQVVVAAGALESPAILLRSKIGGPAVGKYLRLHPTVVVFGYYDEPQEAYYGAPQASLCDEFDNTGEGAGFLIEGPQYGPGILSSAIPWLSGRQHKELTVDARFGAGLIAVTSDHGYGQVRLDGSREAMHTYDVTDPIDKKNIGHGMETIIRIHEAAGARKIFILDKDMSSWDRGDDLEALIAKARSVEPKAGSLVVFSAHQMGTCRMGSDPQISVADPRGELHDVKGVWIGDASAFPTSSGTNPMVTVMALAYRTSGKIAETLAATQTASVKEPVAVAK